jgi:uncharacterized repeat protein (TIGR01451 family)
MNTKRLHAIGSVVLLCLLAIAVLLFLCSPHPAQATQGILYVAPGGNCGAASPCYSTLQDAANAAQAGDQIRVAAGMYPIQAGHDQVVLLDRSLTIQGGYTPGDWNTSDPDNNATTVNALSQGRVIVVSGAVSVTLEGLRLAYGNADGLGGHTACFAEWDAGGGLYVDEATVTLDHTRVLTNTTPSNGFGGGVYAVDATLVLTGSTYVQANYGGAGGGLFLNHTQARLNEATVQDNTAGGAWGGCHHGGGGLNIISDSQVEITASTIHGNKKLITTHGAGILFQDGTLVIRDSLIEDNEGTALQLSSFQAGSDSATIYLGGSVIQNNDGAGVSTGSTSATSAITVTGTLVQGNQNNGWGAGLSISTRALLVANTILDNHTAGNSSMKGGGVFLAGGASSPILFKGNLVSGNTNWIGVGGKGGGVYVQGQNVTLESNTIQGNSALSGISNAPGSGGGIYVAGPATLINNLVIENSAGGPSGRGAGITVAGANPTLYHNTIARNTGGSGSGLYVTESSQPGLPVLYNTIIAEQSIGVEVDSDPPQNLATLYGVLWWANGANTSGTVFAFDQVTGDPAFVDPVGHDYHLDSSSAAIDTGRSDAGITTDLDGQTRPHYSGYDLGADEWWPLVAVKSVTPDTAEPGQVVTYTLTLSNATAGPMTVHLTDTLPVEVDYLGPLVYSSGTGGYATGTITWTGEVLTTTPTLITWAVQVLPNVSAGTTITNTALVSDAYGLFHTDPALVAVPQRYQYVYLPIVLRR